MLFVGKPVLPFTAEVVYPADGTAQSEAEQTVPPDYGMPEKVRIFHKESYYNPYGKRTGRHQCGETAVVRSLEHTEKRDVCR